MNYDKKQYCSPSPSPSPRKIKSPCNKPVKSGKTNFAQLGQLSFEPSLERKGLKVVRLMHRLFGSMPARAFSHPTKRRLREKIQKTGTTILITLPCREETSRLCRCFTTASIPVPFKNRSFTKGRKYARTGMKR